MACHTPPLKKAKKQAITQPRTHPISVTHLQLAAITRQLTMSFWSCQWACLGGNQVNQGWSGLFMLLSSQPPVKIILCFNFFCAFIMQQNTPLHLAAEKDHLDAVTYLVGKGADVNIRNHMGVSE